MPVNTISKALSFVLIWQLLHKLSLLLSPYLFSPHPPLLFFFFKKKQSVRLISLCQRLSRSFLSRSNMSVARSDDTLVSKPVCPGAPFSALGTPNVQAVLFIQPPRNLKLWKWQAYSWSPQRGLGVLIYAPSCFFPLFFSLIWMVLSPLIAPYL